jgi:hypothetical protein
MILGYFGDPITAREIKALTRNKQYDPNKPFTDFTITWFPDLITGLTRRGYTWSTRVYTNSQEGFRSGLADIEEALDRGSPVMVATSLYGGHTFVVSGYADAAQTIFVVGPGINAPGIRIISFKDFTEIWNSLGGGFNHRVAIFPKRR